MPRDASFQLNAKISEKHDIVSDFALKYLREPPPPAPALPRAQLHPPPRRSAWCDAFESVTVMVISEVLPSESVTRMT